MRQNENKLDSAKKAIGTRTINTNAKRNRKPWFTEEMKRHKKNGKLMLHTETRNRLQNIRNTRKLGIGLIT